MGIYIVKICIPIQIKKNNIIYPTIVSVLIDLTIF